MEKKWRLYIKQKLRYEEKVFVIKRILQKSKHGYQVLVKLKAI